MRLLVRLLVLWPVLLPVLRLVLPLPAVLLLAVLNPPWITTRTSPGP